MVATISWDIEPPKPRHERLTSILAAMISFLRGLPLFLSNRPRTPLRVLCLMAFDTLHVLRKSRRLPSHTLQTLAALLDLGACANDFFDKNDFSRREYRATRRQLESAQTSVAVNEYMNRLRNIENRRPSPGGDIQQYKKIQKYREAVNRLSLGMLAATALGDLTLEEGIQATHRDEDLETLYRIVMLCQIIDDVLDFATDSDNRLPSFLTAHASPSQALALTFDAVARYADRRGLSCLPHTLPFRAALSSLSVFAKIALKIGHWGLKPHALRNRSALLGNWSTSTDAHS